MTAIEKRGNRILEGMYIEYNNFDNEMELINCEKIGIKNINEIMNILAAETEGQVVYIERINNEHDITLFVRDEYNENYEYKIRRASNEYYELRAIEEGDVA